MKLYTKIQTLKTKSLIGAVLVGDKNQIYMSTGFEIHNTDEHVASMTSIQRAISFIKNVSPIYASENLEIHNTNLTIEEIKRNEYVSKFLQAKNIDIILCNSSNDFDKQMNMRAGHELLGLSTLERIRNNIHRGENI